MVFKLSEELNIISGTKEEKYQTLIPQVKAVIDSETDLIANLANISACLKQQFNWLWVGFYLVKGEDLVLGPFQGPLACTRIKKGRGVCGASWMEKKTIIVDDINTFPGHIACSSLSLSEIVVPIFHNGEVIGVLDIDSEAYSSFDHTDQKWLEKLVAFITF